MHRLTCIILLVLSVVLPAAAPASAENAAVSRIENLKADATDSRSLLLSWTELSEGPFLYTVTLCNNQTLACQLAGSTTAKSFVLDFLDADTSYSFHVGAAEGNTLELTLTTPEQAAETGGEDGAASALYGQANESVIRDIAVSRMDGGALLVSWTEDAKGAFRYSLSLCETEDSQPVFQGTTTATSFVMDVPEQSAGYCIQIGTTADNTVSYVFPAPGAE